MIAVLPCFKQKKLTLFGGFGAYSAPQTPAGILCVFDMPIFYIVKKQCANIFSVLSPGYSRFL